MKRKTTIKAVSRFEQMEEDLREYYEERAAIAEYCGGLPRKKAEALALNRTIQYKARQYGYTEQAGLFG